MSDELKRAFNHWMHTQPGIDQGRDDQHMIYPSEYNIWVTAANWANAAHAPVPIDEIPDEWKDGRPVIFLKHDTVIQLPFIFYWRDDEFNTPTHGQCWRDEDGSPSLGLTRWFGEHGSYYTHAALPPTIKEVK